MTDVLTKTATAIVDTLRANGVDTVFGIPGVHTLELYDALLDSGVRHVLTRHEQGAGFMADGYARATGRAGVALVITGPGVTNITTPVGQAYTDSSPVVVLSTNVDRAYLDAMRGNLHDLKDQPRLMATLTKWNARALTGAEAIALTERAIKESTAQRPGPVHLEFPKDVLLDEIAELPDSHDVPKAPEPDQKLIAEAAQALSSAGRPVIYAGGGVPYSDAHVELTRLAELLHAPVITSFQGKGAIDESHALALGSLWGAGNAIDDIVRQSDCLLVVGSKLGVQTTEHFRLPFPEQWIRIDIDADELARNATPTLAIQADASVALAALTESVSNVQSIWSNEEIRQARETAQQSTFGFDRIDWIHALRNATPDNGVIAWDMTMMSYVACYHYPVSRPRTFMFPQGFGTLGFALPAAIGAKVGLGSTPVACVVGDGGFQFTMQEIATAVQENLTLPVVIFNDSTYSAVKLEQHEQYDQHYHAVDLINPDYVKFADAYGIPGVRVDNPADLQTELEAAYARSGPTIIDVTISGWV